MTRMPVSLPQQTGAFKTMRRDAWYVQPVAVFLGLLFFVVYSTWAAFQGEYYFHDHYLSPFYAPTLWDAPGVDSGHSWFGPWPTWMPAWVPASPALFILWAPGLFRFTCYYYRGAYYKSFWADPVSCSVGEPRKSYWGERWFPLILQNLHRYFLYVALLFIFILSYDAFLGLWHTNEATGETEFGVGIGTIVLTVNAILLAGYTLGCHSLRHLVGGKCDSVSNAPMGKKTYDCVSCLNSRHMLFAWMSLFWVGFADFYVRMCAMGVWTDWRLF
ncbi:MAG: hypothetical protein WD294_12865 [Phycisphaeraceae bacterium]